MKYTLHTLFAAVLLNLGYQAQAQTVATFENVALPGPDTTYLDTQIPNGDGVYTFQSGNALFYGNITWGNYWGNFNCSNKTDTVLPALGNVITGSGYDGSDNFAIAYVPIDFMSPTDPTATIPVGTKLQGAAAGSYVLGTYVTNSVYAYRYMLDGDKYANNHYWLKLVIRGYLNGTQTANTVDFTLADFTNGTPPVLVNTWEWVDLVSLGKVDSVTFDLISNDNQGGFGINTPAYFAIDNFTTSDGVCFTAHHIAAVSVNENSATINWQGGVTGITTGYEVAVDQSATLAPTGTPATVTAATYSANGLSNNTLYYAHVRSVCNDGGFSAWDTASFRTLATNGINGPGYSNPALQLSPNPAANHLNILTDHAVEATVYSIEGKLLLHVPAARSLDITALPAGMYLLKVSDREGKLSGTTRFIKQN